MCEKRKGKEIQLKANNRSLMFLPPLRPCFVVEVLYIKH